MHHLGSAASIGTPYSKVSTKVLLLGAGELAKEVVIECKRLGAEVIACDRYEHAPAMQLADRAYTFSMLDESALQEVIEKEQPDFVVPEIEAIATDLLVKLEAEGLNVVPTARAAQLTMNREGIRRLAAEELGLPTSNYQFCSDFDEFRAAVNTIGLPCISKPIMSSSGKGQSLLKSEQDIEQAWKYAQEGGRAGGGRVIVEGFVDFDFEITLLTVRHIGGTSFCAPIGHRQEDGDYQESWQPQQMTELALKRSEQIAQTVTDALGGYGIFGVELFIKGDEVIFSEVSPRPHDTGMVTLISQNLSEFALHARAFMGLPIPAIRQYAPAASCVLLVEGKGCEITYDNVAGALALANTDLRLFGKPEVDGKRRMGVALALGDSVDEAKSKAIQSSEAVRVTVK
ncbi:formate-dependent phosphoribosylglycinamide formyltransferase [Agaribacterium haliotis]|uniref:formate-dependent phosphoribosylglycinamide formyltransferase n=1 Tax=Agaribacterium haliotis TaxID=2013869 RepID=UPI000BB58660|nr:formate-dependent phosphoribosylglycinamide formyltransferase [Agaribacterium haliotis]